MRKLLLSSLSTYAIPNTCMYVVCTAVVCMMMIMTTAYDKQLTTCKNTWKRTQTRARARTYRNKHIHAFATQTSDFGLVRIRGRCYCARWLTAKAAGATLTALDFFLNKIVR